MPEVLIPSHLACAVTVDVRSPDVSRNFRQSEVPTQARSPDTYGSAGWLSALVENPDVRQNFRLSEVPDLVGSPDTRGFTGCLIAHVGSPDVRRKFRPSEVPTFAGSSDTDLHARTSDSL